MEASIALIVLTAALFHATWNATVKSGKDSLITLTGVNVATGCIALPIAFMVGLPSSESWPYLIASAILHFGYYIALSEAYRFGDFSQAYPIARGTAPIIVTLYGVFVLGEILSLFETLSLIGIIAGLLIFVTRGFGRVVQDKHALFAALATSAFIGGYTIVDGIGGRLSENVPGYMVWLSILDAVPILIYTTLKRNVSQVMTLCKEWKILLVGGALALSSYSMVVWSMTQAPIPLVSALRETSIIIAALIGAFYFKEPSGKRRIIASIVIFLSVVLLAFDSN